MTEAVKAYIQLYRPSDGVTSQPRNFYFTPLLDGPIHGAKRFKTDQLTEIALLDTSTLFPQQSQQLLVTAGPPPSVNNNFQHVFQQQQQNSLAAIVNDASNVTNVKQPLPPCPETPEISRAFSVAMPGHQAEDNRKVSLKRQSPGMGPMMSGSNSKTSTPHHHILQQPYIKEEVL